ncbi:MAG TPA: hypothetical protein VLE91_00840 [Candidatus Saccharimonadales bacterium]|nr:hypothetical protein [Candidatus Saccharimonadales bacterium]
MQKIFKKPDLILLLTILAVIATTVTIFAKGLSYFFFQDDWFVLYQTNIHTLKEFFSLLWFRQDVIYFRPLGMQLFFFASQKIFGLNPLLFHSVAFLLHLVNIALIWTLAGRIFKNKFAASISTILFSSAAFHFMTLSWLSLTWNIIGTFFFLLTLKLFLDLKDRLSIKSVILITISFILALSSTEFALILPVYAVALELYENKPDVKKMAKVQTPTLIVIFLYILCRLLIYKVPVDSNYALTIDTRAFTNLIWYFLWLLNLPEVLKYHFHLASLSIDKADPTFLQPFSPYVKPIFTSFALFTLTTVILVYKNLNKKTFIVGIFCIGLFTCALAPVLFLPDHSFPYYLSIPSLSIIFFVAYLITNIKSESLKRILVLILGASYISTSVLSVSFTRKTHWIGAEENISKMIVQAVKTQNDLHKSKITIYPANYQTSQSLMDQYALWVIYNRKVMTTFEESKESTPAPGVTYINIK